MLGLCCFLCLSFAHKKSPTEVGLEVRSHQMGYCFLPEAVSSPGETFLLSEESPL